MWTLRTAHDPAAPRGRLKPEPLSLRCVARGTGALLAFAAGVLHTVVQAQPATTTTPPPSPAEVELIATVQANGVPRGEFLMRRLADGDFWMPAKDLERLKVAPLPQALRQSAGERFYSLRALGARELLFDEATLTLALNFDAASLAGTRIDLAPRPAAAPSTTANSSLILSYRLAARAGTGTATTASLEHDLNVRVAGILLRQAGRIDSAAFGRKYLRQATQLLRDDFRTATRTVVGDVVSSAGNFGTAITGAGIVYRKLYDLRPDVVTQPLATLRASTTLPALVEVSVDGSTIHRANVGPGPITVDNLLLYGGARNVRVTITDAAGRREVIEQPFFFTDAVLAPGLHDFSYFAGKRSDLDATGQWRYREPAWQAWHRYGATDAVTVSAGGEGSSAFANAGAGIALRIDRVGVVAGDVLASHDRATGTSARGMSGRYTYVSPRGALVIGRRWFDPGYRSFLTSPLLPFLRRQDQVAFSTRLGRASVGAEWSRTEDALEKRTTATVRLSTTIAGRTTLSGELQSILVNGKRDWVAYAFLRTELDRQRWAGATVRAGPDARGIDLETGKQLQSGEGLGYRLGLSGSQLGGETTGTAIGSANWNLRPFSLEFSGASALRGNSQHGELAIAGALAAVEGSWGLTRQVNDSFVLARLGIPQAGVEILLNNQVQGKTDANGELLIPQVGAFGRQDVTLNERQLGMEYTYRETVQRVVPAYRSGTVVEFGARKLRAVAGMAWLRGGPAPVPLVNASWTLSSPTAKLTIETGRTGDFYLEDVQPGAYTGTVTVDGREYSCRVTVPEFPEPVHELKEGILCD